ncbi:hypothetical protein [Halorussus ruber]|uniref:hypothetical protein n=1 Tax=Halorussus ruber TaxID=1126238 RepID=UPI001091B498|nr:hypothetical protein [Halorussus ruber]
MRRKAIAALLLVGAVGAGAFVVGSESAATVRSVEVLDTECDDSSYQSRLEQRPTDGGTRVVVEDVFVASSPGHALDASLAEESGNYTLTLTAREETTDAERRDCAGELHYRAVVFVPTESFDLTVVHGDEDHVVLHDGESSSWSGSDSSAQGSAAESSSAAESAEGSASEGASSEESPEESAASEPATTTPSD